MEFEGGLGAGFIWGLGAGMDFKGSLGAGMGFKGGLGAGLGQRLSQRKAIISAFFGLE